MILPVKPKETLQVFLWITGFPIFISLIFGGHEATLSTLWIFSFAFYITAAVFYQQKYAHNTRFALLLGILGILIGLVVFLANFQYIVVI